MCLFLVAITATTVQDNEMCALFTKILCHLCIVCYTSSLVIHLHRAELVMNYFVFIFPCFVARARGGVYMTFFMFTCEAAQLLPLLSLYGTAHYFHK